MKPRNLRIAVALSFSTVYILFWLFIAFLYFVKKNFEALFFLAMASFPWYIVVSPITHGIANSGGYEQYGTVLMDFGALLVLGTLQYFIAGYAIAAATQWGVSITKQLSTRDPP